MTKQYFRRALKRGSVVFLFAGVLGAISFVNAVADEKKSEPAAKPAPAKPAGNAGGGVVRGSSNGGAATHDPAVSHRQPAGGGDARTPANGGSGAHAPAATGAMRQGAETETRRVLPGASGGSGSRGTFGANNSVIKTPAPRGSSERITVTGDAVRLRSNGRVSDVHDSMRGVDVHQSLNGGRKVLLDRPDRSRIVAEKGRPGFVQRPYAFRGHDYLRRSYYYHGRAYDHYYRGYGYRGVQLIVYIPGYYYSPAYYGWAYNPWSTAIVFQWGWVGNPWYGHYGYYFQPYPVYYSAVFWLTDYMIAQDLQDSYAAYQEAGESYGNAPATGYGQPVLTPEIKQLIADEVRNQLALEKQEAAQNASNQDVDPASNGIARLLSDGRSHVFVVGDNLDLMDESGRECAISDGDVLQLKTAPPADATTADLVVLSSKGALECPISHTVQVQLTDLQEMQNHMRASIDQGLGELQEKQGTGGLPAVPASAQAQPAPAPYAAAAPSPESNLGSLIQQQIQQGEQAEKEVINETAQGSGVQEGVAPAAPVTIELGQTTDQVQSALGVPARVANLGSKVIYYYDDMKVIFKDGKVSDVE